MKLPLLSFAPVALAVVLAAACGSDAGEGGAGGSSTRSASSSATDAATTDAASTSTDVASSSVTGFPMTAICDELSLPKLPFVASAQSAHRGDIAGDFELELLGEPAFGFAAAYTGCESYVFVPDTLAVSDLDPSSIWEKDADLAQLVELSPPNVHYFFVSRKADAATADAALSAMRARIDAFVATLDPTAAARWGQRLHVVAKPAGDIAGWVGPILKSGIGRGGFAIDRSQRIRGVGYLADVTRFKQALANADKWPWESNLAYAAYEPRLYELEATRDVALANDGATVVELFGGEVLTENFVELDVALPTPAEMATFDTLTIDITSMCPDVDAPELGNCGAWDYLAYLFVRDDATMENVEVARFITSYHRETRWVVDASPMLALFKDGGTRHFRWEFSPEWNPQHTGTKLALRFSNQGKPDRPASITRLFTGGDLSPTYNDEHPPVVAPIPATATRVELHSLVTGHGAGTAQCAEFCNHAHELGVNGTIHRKDHPEAQTQQGCVAEVDQGMTPNQGGTWWYGRGGWCPGQYVRPWTVDVTADLTPGMDATFSYRALVNGNPPPAGAGNIVLSTYLVTYE